MWSLPRQSPGSSCLVAQAPPSPPSQCRLPTVSGGSCKTTSGPALEVHLGPGCILLVQQIAEAGPDFRGEERDPTSQGEESRSHQCFPPVSLPHGEARSGKAGRCGAGDAVMMMIVALVFLFCFWCGNKTHKLL